MLSCHFSLLEIKCAQNLPISEVIVVRMHFFESLLRLASFYTYFKQVEEFEPHRDKTNKMACAPSEDSDQPGHPPSLIRVFAMCLMDS